MKKIAVYLDDVTGEVYPDHRAAVAAYNDGATIRVYWSHVGRSDNDMIWAH